MVLGYWQDDQAYDLDGDGLIDGVDLAIVLGGWDLPGLITRPDSPRCRSADILEFHQSPNRLEPDGSSARRCCRPGLFTRRMCSPSWLTRNRSRPMTSGTRRRIQIPPAEALVGVVVDGELADEAAAHSLTTSSV